MSIEFFHKAKNNLNVAQLCFDNGFYDACANRAYYAALQAAVAALADKGIKKEKIDHRLVQAEFSSKLIRGRKIYPQKMKSYLMDMQMVRNDADYSDERVRDYPNNNLPALTAKYAEFSAEERRELCGTPRFTLRSLRSVIYWEMPKQKTGFRAASYGRRNADHDRKGIKTMKINFKQEELIRKLIRTIRRKFPEVRLIDVTESPEGPETLWINITAPEDEDREIELRRFGSDKAMDILLDYGYHLLVMPKKKQRKGNRADKEILMAA